MKIGLAGSYAFSKRFVLEAQVNSWFFTENSSFYNGNTLKQNPLISVQVHGIYSFKPGVWLAASIGRSFMGETKLNGVEKNDGKNDWRYGAVFVYRINRQNALKIGFTTGLSTRYGADFTSFFLAYQFTWFDKNSKSP